MNFEELIIRREAVRSFSNKKVEEEKLNKILEAGRVAPTAKNIQPIKMYVINTEKGNEKLDKATPCRYNALTSILVCGNKEEGWKNEKENYPSVEVDAAIVTTHMMLEATNLGVDNIWVRYFDTEILRKEFIIPDNLVPVALLNLGYKTEDYEGNPMHNVRKNIEDIVEYR